MASIFAADIESGEVYDFMLAPENRYGIPQERWDRLADSNPTRRANAMRELLSDQWTKTADLYFDYMNYKTTGLPVRRAQYGAMLEYWTRTRFLVATNGKFGVKRMTELTDETTEFMTALQSRARSFGGDRPALAEFAGLDPKEFRKWVSKRSLKQRFRGLLGRP